MLRECSKELMNPHRSVVHQKEPFYPKQFRTPSLIRNQRNKFKIKRYLLQKLIKKRSRSTMRIFRSECLGNHHHHASLTLIFRKMLKNAKKTKLLKQWKNVQIDLYFPYFP